MSNDKKAEAPRVKLTNEQKDTARRLDMTESEYAAGLAEGVKRGMIKREHIR